MEPSAAIRQTVARYYADRLREFGATARGVDWKSADSQELRFDQLLTVVEDDADASLVDVGCGYGALLDTIRRRGLTLDYRGCDFSDEMLAAARGRHAADPKATFSADLAAFPPSTYAVASGIFNVRLHHDDVEWRDYVHATIRQLDAAGTRGFAFNMLSTYSDVDRRRATLYYADPLEMFDLCKRVYSRRVALLHDSPLYEFTIVVRK